MPKSTYTTDIDPHIGTRKISPCKCKTWWYEKSFLEYYEKRFGIDYFTNIQNGIEKLCLMCHSPYKFEKIEKTKTYKIKEYLNNKLCYAGKKLEHYCISAIWIGIAIVLTPIALIGKTD